MSDSFDTWPLNGLVCPECRLPQRDTSSGASCPKGHGGLEGVVVPTAQEHAQGYMGPPRMAMRGSADLPRDETRLVFLDLETTGLIPEKHVILEVGACVVSAELDYLSAIAGPESDRLFFHRYPQWPGSARSLLLTSDAHVQEMHQKSGLIDDSEAVRHERFNEIAHNGLGDIEDELIDWLTNGHQFEPKTAVLVGSGINFDRSFIKARMPKLDAFLHYRMLDVTALREAHRRWVDPLYEKPVPPHRVKADIRCALDELRLFRKTMREAEERGAMWLWQAMAAGEINTRSTGDEILAAIEAARDGA